MAAVWEAANKATIREHGGNKMQKMSAIILIREAILRGFVFNITVCCFATFYIAGPWEDFETLKPHAELTLFVQRVLGQVLSSSRCCEWKADVKVCTCITPVLSCPARCASGVKPHLSAVVWNKAAACEAKP